MKLRPGRNITNSEEQTREALRDNEGSRVSDRLTKQQAGSHGVRKGGSVVVVPKQKK